jgi:hypothetical protein
VTVRLSPLARVTVELSENGEYQRTVQVAPEAVPAVPPAEPVAMNIPLTAVQVVPEEFVKVTPPV